MKKTIIITVVIFTTLIGGVAGGVVFGASSDDLMGAVSRNCSSIMGQLQNVRYYDRRAREYLGNRYESLVGGYVVSLNVRLVKNNMANVRLQELQGELVGLHASFKSEFSQYATEMDTLMGMNCALEPEGFYEGLVRVRERRGLVRGLVEGLNGGLAEYRGVVEEMRGQL